MAQPTRILSGALSELAGWQAATTRTANPAAAAANNRRFSRRIWDSRRATSYMAFLKKSTVLRRATVFDPRLPIDKNLLYVQN
jgi:hypothetical protein